MTTLDSELSAQLEVLKQQFAAGLPTRLDRIDTALRACSADPTNPTARAALVTALHSLGGAAGIFGFTVLGQQARQAELEVTQWADQPCTAEQLEQIATTAQTWRSLC